MIPLPEIVRELTPDEQPVEKLVEVAGLYLRTYHLPMVGMVVPQHVHDYDHATLICSGKLRGWCEGEWIGDKGPGEAFLIKAGCQHTFESLEPSMLTCIHNIQDALDSHKGI